MKVCLIDVDGHNFPNLALMKIAAYHKALGDEVEWYMPLFSHPDRIYASKIFTFTPDYQYFPADSDIVKGGTGYDVKSRLPDEIENMPPDYSIYPQYDYCIGFLTRGCPNNCPWCIVPRKEGGIHVVSNIEKIAVRKTVKLMDNNFLAADIDFVREQLEKMKRLDLKIDFNQALDCRRVDYWNASQLASIKWERYIRFSCDTDAAKEPLENAVRLLREYGYKREIFVYILAKDMDALNRVEFCERIGVIPFIMPFRDLHDASYQIPHDLKRLARWCNIQSIRKSIPFQYYKA